METVWDLVVVVHLVGMAAVVGGWLTQLGAARPRVPAVVVYGAVAQVISGPALVGLASSGAVDKDVDNVKIGVKLVIALAVFVVAYLGLRRDDEERALPAPASASASGGGAGTVSAARAVDPRAPVNLAGGLALVNVLIAVLWR
ncbi:hypothetical protein [Pseudofrankia asymbiotica]|uniref:Uncharacterized protein n=1 Tax=Pseudofrankia asymbiotica TaxID=1834516 RepID=A0A1V2I364_9ACTN|nr:hypothetical protein [Pseudofrankia asymbiotica]ONH24537.1 hypothetical protein BL253_30055 [Pseudofrankia asymbiotica]